MCGRLSQYRGIHDFVAVLSIPDALINHVGDEPLARYNAAPTTQLALLHLENDGLHADSHALGLAAALGEGSRGADQCAGRESRPWPVLPGDLAASRDLPDRQLVRMGRCRGRHPATLADSPARPGAGFLCGDRPVPASAAPRPGTTTVSSSSPPTAPAACWTFMTAARWCCRAELAREWLDPATPKERAEQMVLFAGRRQ